ncbi:MAG: lipopolysaccharide heptosyltransferase II [Planctomycetaceae bacterium]|nr:lipopolysaccharide heptosyltransferase II [Planctomycetaceae bacterium]
MSSRWKTARRVLCVRLDTLGDVLMSTPAVAAIKHSLPDCSLTLLTSTAGGALADLLPDLDRFIAYDAPWMKRTAERATAEADEKLICQLAEEQFDAAVVFTAFSQSPLPAALLCYLAGIPLRAAHCRENPYQLLTDWVREREPEEQIRHEVRRQLDLVASLGYETADERLRLSVPSGASERVPSILRECGVDTRRPWLVIHPGGSAPSRRYPPELYGQIARMLQETYGMQIVFTGIEAEREIVDVARGHTPNPPPSLVGRLDLAELAALLAIAPLLLTNNTGPAHMAAALGTPVVDLYALTNPQHTPWHTPCRVLSHDVPCKNCFRSVCPFEHHRCLREVPPSAVVAAVTELLADVNLRGARASVHPWREPELVRGNMYSA